MDAKKRDEIIQKLAKYLLHYCPMGALKDGETCDVALCYPKKDALPRLREQQERMVAEGSLLDMSIKDIKAVAGSKVLARLVGADRTSFLVRRKGEPRTIKGTIRLAKKTTPAPEA